MAASQIVNPMKAIDARQAATGASTLTNEVAERTRMKGSNAIMSAERATDSRHAVLQSTSGDMAESIVFSCHHVGLTTFHLRAATCTDDNDIERRSMTRKYHFEAAVHCDSKKPNPFLISVVPVSYTHLTLPTKRIV